jgi:hypothetical protein
MLRHVLSRFKRVQDMAQHFLFLRQNFTSFFAVIVSGGQTKSTPPSQTS